MQQLITFVLYRALDSLKQRSLLLWALTMLLLWGGFILLSLDIVSFKGESVVMVIIGGLISGVGVRTSKQLVLAKEAYEATEKIKASSFNTKLQHYIKKIKSSTPDLDKTVSKRKQKRG